MNTSGYPIESGNLWPAGQRLAHSLHEISYRGCFKPQLAAYFIERFTRPGDKVCDPFMGRGTTPLEAALLERIAVGIDANPLGEMLVRPRLNPPEISEVASRLSVIPWELSSNLDEDLLAFYHPETLQKISALREYFFERERTQKLDAVDEWIRLVALNRLSGHSAGFFSVRTMPPNQAVPVSRQLEINTRHHQHPPQRDVAALILKKSRSLLRNLTRSQAENLQKIYSRHKITTGLAEKMAHLGDKSVSLVVTSPPFLDVVNYRKDNWLRCWFAGINPENIPKLTSSPAVWTDQFGNALREMVRIVKSGGHIGIEVGEVKKGRIKMEELVLQAGKRLGLNQAQIFINVQKFTKTSHCWGIKNNTEGTNTNRIVLFSVP